MSNESQLSALSETLCKWRMEADDVYPKSADWLDGYHHALNQVIGCLPFLRREPESRYRCERCGRVGSDSEGDLDGRAHCQDINSGACMGLVRREPKPRFNPRSAYGGQAAGDKPIDEIKPPTPKPAIESQLPVERRCDCFPGTMCLNDHTCREPEPPPCHMCRGGGGSPLVICRTCLDSIPEPSAHTEREETTVSEPNISESYREVREPECWCSDIELTDTALCPRHGSAEIEAAQLEFARKHKAVLDRPDSEPCARCGNPHAPWLLCEEIAEYDAALQNTGVTDPACSWREMADTGHHCVLPEDHEGECEFAPDTSNVRSDTVQNIGDTEPTSEESYCPQCGGELPDCHTESCSYWCRLLVSDENLHTSGQHVEVFIVERNYIREAMTDYYGEQGECPEYDDTCHGCRAWRQYEDFFGSQPAICNDSDPPNATDESAQNEHSYPQFMRESALSEAPGRNASHKAVCPRVQCQNEYHRRLVEIEAMRSVVEAATAWRISDGRSSAIEYALRCAVDAYRKAINE